MAHEHKRVLSELNSPKQVNNVSVSLNSTYVALGPLGETEIMSDATLLEKRNVFLLHISVSH